MIRAVQIYNAFFAPRGERSPWMRMPDLGIRLADYRLFHYVLPRLSFRQYRWMRFGGLVGCLDLEGDLTPAMPFPRAAEILHFGRKATFGLGRNRCVGGWTHEQAIQGLVAAWQSSSETGSADDKNRPWEPFDTVVTCLERQS